MTLHDYLRVVRRRKWLVVLAALILSLAALAFSLHQQKRYEASADVLLNSQNAAATPAGRALDGPLGGSRTGHPDAGPRRTQARGRGERAASGQRRRPERQRFRG